MICVGAATPFWSWEFFEKPLQGAVQWLIVIILTAIGGSVIKRREKLIAVAKEQTKRLQWLRITYYTSVVVSDTMIPYFVVRDGWSLHNARSNSLRLTCWLGIWFLTYVRMRGILLMRQQTLYINVKVAEQYDNSISEFFEPRLADWSELSMILILLSAAVAVYLGVILN